MLEAFLTSTIIAGVPLLFATLGELITEKSGNLNLGVEGMMIMGAIIGFATAYGTHNPGLALLGAIAAGAAGAAIFAFLTISLRANQVVAGLALTMFGTGFASFMGKNYVGLVIPNAVKTFFVPVEIPLLSKIPVIGQPLFHQDVFVYLAYVCVAVTWVYLQRTRKGLNLRAVGENAAAADASGINVNLYRYVHTIAGGALCGLGGAYLSIVAVPVWQDNVTAGRGWIAVALVIFASWNPVKALFGALLFGGLDIIGFRFQSMGIHVSQYLIDMLPYAATILVLVLSTYKSKKENQPPENLSVPYFREER